MSYDQWKTASPYDDDPDYVEECAKYGNKCLEALKDEDAYTIGEIKQLLEDCGNFLIEVANYLEDM